MPVAPVFLQGAREHVLAPKRLELGDKEGSSNPAQLERSRHAQHIVPVAKDQPGFEGAPDEPANILIANAGVEPVELLISQVAQAGRELQTQQVEQTENQIRVASRVGSVLRNRQFGFVVEDAVEHVGRIADRGGDGLAPVLRELVRGPRIEG